MAKELRDFLVGVDNASQVEAIIKDNMKNEKCKLFIDDGKENIYVPISRLNAKIGELATATDTITSLNQTVTELKSKVGSGDEKAQEKITELQTKIGEYESKLKDTQINNAIEVIGLEFKARDVKDLKAFVDMSKVAISDKGEVTGLKEQVETLQKEKAYLFNEVPDPEGDKGKPSVPSFFGPGFMGKPDNSSIFGSQTSHEGDFGKTLFQASHTTQTDGEKEINPDYYFNK